MKALHYDKSGDINVLKLGQVPKQTISAPDDVLIKVYASAINPIDYKRMGGLVQEKVWPVVCGYDVAGTVEEVGKDVKRFKAGDAVYGNVHVNAIVPTQHGSMADFVVCKASVLAKKPTKLSWTEAAAIPLAAQTAYQAFEKGSLAKGQKVLITAGAGGVGTFALQIAKKMFNAGTVYTTGSSPKLEQLKAFGADELINYKKVKFEETVSDLDMVFDLTHEASKATKVVKQDGKVRVISIVAFEKAEGVTSFVIQSSGALLEKMNPLFESGELVVKIDKEFAFDDCIAAWKHAMENRPFGKVVIKHL